MFKVLFIMVFDKLHLYLFVGHYLVDNETVEERSIEVLVVYLCNLVYLLLTSSSG
jgi:hypothetical protein